MTKYHMTVIYIYYDMHIKSLVYDHRNTHHHINWFPLILNDFYWYVYYVCPLCLWTRKSGSQLVDFSLALICFMILFSIYSKMFTKTITELSTIYICDAPIIKSVIAHYF